MRWERLAKRQGRHGCGNIPMVLTGSVRDAVAELILSRGAGRRNFIKGQRQDFSDHFAEVLLTEGKVLRRHLVH